MIHVKGFSFQYKNSDAFALRDMDFHIEKGDFIGIIGSCGAGKSTLTYALNGVIPHHYTGDFYGEVRVAGLDTVDSKPEDIAMHVGNVFQDIDGQMVASVVEDEILFGLENFQVPAEEIDKRMSDALEMIGISKLRHRRISTLSGGQKQKVAIAAVVALMPDILILDEPTGELDPQSSQQIFEMLKKLNEEFGMTIVIVEQKIALLCEYVKKLMVLNKGRLILFDTAKNVLAQGDKLEEVGIHYPRVAQLASALKEKDLYQGEMPINVDEAVSMVRSVIG